MTEQKKASKAVFPVVEAPYPKVAWEYHRIFGGSDKYDENDQPIDENTWRSHSIHIPPQKRFDAAYKSGLLAEWTRVTINAARVNVSSGIYTTIDTRVLFEVKELLYPGDKMANVEGKWIYAFHVNAGTALAEIFAINAGKWLVRYEPTFPANASLPPPDKECPGKLELPMIKASEAGSNVGFLISPFRLTATAIDYLLEDPQRLKDTCVCAVREQSGQFFAAAPDPYQWALEAHEKYYIPLVDEWQSFVFDPEIQAKNFIAGTLKAWIEAEDDGLIWNSKDPLDIEDELKSRDELLGMGEPHRHLEQYRLTEEDLRVKAEKAGAYLYHCVYSPEYRALEMAALEAKDLSLTLTFQNWAVVCERACETAQGRMFAVRAYKDPERLPRQYLFMDEAVPPLGERLGINFPNARYAWAAGIAIVGDLLPSVFEYYKDIVDKDQAKRSAEALAEATRIIRRQVMTYLENVGVHVKSSMENPDRIHELRRYGKRIYEQLAGAKDGEQQKMVRAMEEVYKKIQKHTPPVDVPVKPATEAEVLMAQQKIDPNTRLAKMNKWYDDSFIKENRFKIAVVFETINVVIGIIEFSGKEGKAELTNDKFISLIGASADFTSVVAETAFSKIGWEKIGRFAVGKGVAGIAGVIGGICQMSDEQRQMVEGAAQYDFGVATGHGLAAAGAAMTAIGGGLVLAQAIGYGSAAGGPIGALIGAIGAGLIIAGNLLAAWLKDNQHEQFARFCFLGKQYDTIGTKYKELSDKMNEYNPVARMVGYKPDHRLPVYFEWSAEGGLPTKDILKEARLLMWLLSGFRLELEKEHAGDPAKGSSASPEAYVKLIPGYLTPGARIEIKIEQVYTHQYGVNPQEKFEATLLFDQAKEELVFLHGNMQPLLKKSKVDRDQFQNITMIKFPIRPESVKYDGKTVPFDTYLDYPGVENNQAMGSQQLANHKDPGAVHMMGAKMFGIPRYTRTSIVKAQIVMGGVFQPSASNYLELKTLSDDKASTSNRDDWSN